MSTTLTLTNNVILNADEAARGFTLTPTLDGARLEFRVRIWTNRDPEPPLNGIQFSGTLVATSSSGTRRYELCVVSSDNLFAPRANGQDVNLVGRVSAAALRELDEVRQGGRLMMELEMPKAVWIDGSQPSPALMQSYGTNIAFQLFGEQWTAELEKVTATSYVEVMVPITDNEELRIAAGRIRTARRYIGEGNLDAVVGELRKALEPVREAYDVVKLQADALNKTGADKKNRTKEERWALAVQNLYDYLSAFVHDDSEAVKGSVMDRAEANDALASVAGKLHRLAVDRRAGLR